MTKKNCEDKIKEIEKQISAWTTVDTVLMEKLIEDADQLAHLTRLNNYGSKMAALIEWIDEIVKISTNVIVIVSQVRIYYYFFGCGSSIIFLFCTL